MSLDELIRRYKVKPGEGSPMRRAARIEALWRLGRTHASQGRSHLTHDKFRTHMEFDAYRAGFRSQRQTNPLRRRARHSALWDRCVEDIRRRGSAVSPYAVCTASLRELSYRNPIRDPEHRKLLKQLKRHFESDERKERKRRRHP